MGPIRLLRFLAENKARRKGNGKDLFVLLGDE